MLKVPLNRVVAFLGPYISLAAGAFAAWLVAKANVLGIPGLDEANVATWIAAGATWVLTSGLSHLGQWQWLKGHHILLTNASDGSLIALEAAGLMRAPKPPRKPKPAPKPEAPVVMPLPQDGDNSMLQAVDGDASEPVAPDPASGSRVSVGKEPQPFEDPGA